MQILAIGGAIQRMQDWVVTLGVPEPLAFIVTAAICVAGASILTVGLMVIIWRNRKALVRDHDLKLARFSAPRLPGISVLNALRIPTPTFKVDLSGFRGIGMALGVVGVGFILAFTFVIAGTDDTPVWPEVGAAYALPIVEGVKLEPDIVPTEKSQTLLIMLADGVRLDKLTLSGLNVGKIGLTSPCFQIARDSTNTTGFLYVDDLTMINVTAPSFDMANSEFGTFTLGAAAVDGHTMSATLDSTISDQIINSVRGAGNFTASDSTVDRVIIQTLGNATISTLELNDFQCGISATADGAFDIDHVIGGLFSLDGSSRFGDGDGIDVADFIVNSTTKARVISDSLVDTPVTVR